MNSRRSFIFQMMSAAAIAALPAIPFQKPKIKIQGSTITIPDSMTFDGKGKVFKNVKFIVGTNVKICNCVFAGSNYVRVVPLHKNKHMNSLISDCIFDGTGLYMG